MPSWFRRVAVSQATWVLFQQGTETLATPWPFCVAHNSQWTDTGAFILLHSL